MAQPAGPVVYSVHPVVAYTKAVIANLPQKTGRTLEAWVELVQAEGPTAEKDRLAWLRSQHGIGNTYAMVIALRSVGKGAEESDAAAYLAAAPTYVDAMFSGTRAAMRSWYEALLELGLALGPDVKVSPARTIVPLYRNHVFAQVKAATNSRIDFGLALKGTPAAGRLIETGGFKTGDRISHRIPITSREDINEEVKHWLGIAYDMDA